MPSSLVFRGAPLSSEGSFKVSCATHSIARGVCRSTRFSSFRRVWTGVPSRSTSPNTCSMSIFSPIGTAASSESSARSGQFLRAAKSSCDGLVKFQNLEDVAVIVGPFAERGRGFRGAHVRAFEADGIEPGGPRRQQHPGGRRKVTFILAIVGYHHGGQREILSAAGTNRLQIEITVG